VHENERDEFDFFGLSEIDKIQEAIEKDLANEGQTTATPQDDAAFAKFFLVPEEKKHGDEWADIYDDLADASGEPPASYRVIAKPAPEKSWFGVAVALMFACTLGMGILGFGIGAGLSFFGGAEPPLPAEVVAPGAEFTATSYVFEMEREVASLSDMIELIAPSVVGITTHRAHHDRPHMQLFDPIASYGSGIIFAYTHDRIFIATNLYVVRPGYRWDVSIDGSAPIEARPVGTNDDYDLAVAYILNADLMAAGIGEVTFASFGDSDEMRIGDVVLAIGNAMGEGTAVTQGILSAAERPLYLPGREYPIPLLQTDAAINYGNSGGPLLNTRGEIIGINMNRATRLMTDPSLAEGMGYSISANVAAPILLEIAANYRMPAIGISGRSLAEDLENRAELWGIPALGVIILEVHEGRAAYNADLREGDIITAFDGQPVFDMPQLQAAIRAKEIGDIVEIRILRGGSVAHTVEVELAKMIRDFF